MSDNQAKVHVVSAHLHPEKFLADRLAVFIEPGVAIAVHQAGRDQAKKGVYHLRHWPNTGDDRDPRSEMQPGILYEQYGKQCWDPILRDDEVKVI